MLAINVPADGLFLAVQNKAAGDYSKENCERIIHAYIGKMLEAKPDVILLNACYRRALTPSEVFDSYLYDVETDSDGYACRDAEGKSIKTLSPVSENVSKYFASFFKCARVLLSRGIDIYQMAIDRIRESDTQVYLSLRMNDGHYTENAAVNSSFAQKFGGKHTIEHDGVNLDFSQSAVQNYFLAYINELLENYDIDGIELDWLRFPGILPQQKRADLSIIRDYMQRVRRLMDDYNEKLCLAVRVLPTEEENLAEGLDVCGWIANGCADMLTVENFYVPTNYELPIARWREAIAKRNRENKPYLLYCGSDWAVACTQRYSVAMSPALVRGFADTCLARGADGVYLFNFFEEDDTSSFELVEDVSGAHLENCFVTRMIAARHPEALPRRYVHIGNDAKRYPIALGQGESYAFSQTKKNLSDRVRLVIGTDTDAPLCVTVGAASVMAEERIQAPEGFAYIPREEIGKQGEFIYAVTQAAPVVRSVTLSADAVKENAVIEIRNMHAEEAKILWLETVCE